MFEGDGGVFRLDEMDNIRSTLAQTRDERTILRVQGALNAQPQGLRFMRVRAR